MRLHALVILSALALTACGGYRNGRDGAPGPAGPKGDAGDPGINGHSVVLASTQATGTQCPAGGSVLLVAVDLDDSGDLDPLVDGSLQSLVVCNGEDGDDGSDAPPTQFTPVAVLDPCGDAPNRRDEVLLKLADGSILASFSDSANGQNTRFSLLGDGTYQTTDGDACVFTLSGGSIVYENHHY